MHTRSRRGLLTRRIEYIGALGRAIFACVSLFGVIRTRIIRHCQRDCGWVDHHHALLVIGLLWDVYSARASRAVHLVTAL